MASNALLCGCENRDPLPSQKVPDEPVISTAGARSAEESAPAPPADAGLRTRLPQCARGYRSSQDPKLDALRLGALCGPSNGLALEPAWVFAPRDDDEVVRASLEEGECVWAVATSATVSKFELTWVGGANVVASCELEGFGWCPISEPLCVERPTELALQVGEEAGKPAPQIVVWSRRSPRRITPPAATPGQP